MAAITFQFDTKELGVFGNDKVARQLARAVKLAGNEALKSLRTSSQRYVRERKRLKVARVKKGLPVTKPRGSRMDQLVWRMDVSGRPIKIADYPYRQVKKGVSAGINKGNRALVPGAFVATLKSGHTGVFIRRGAARFPIKELYSSTIAQVFNDGGMIPNQYEKAQFVFGRAVKRLLPLELAKVKP